MEELEKIKRIMTVMAGLDVYHREGVVDKDREFPSREVDLLR